MDDSKAEKHKRCLAQYENFMKTMQRIMVSGTAKKPTADRLIAFDNANKQMADRPAAKSYASHSAVEHGERAECSQEVLDRIFWLRNELFELEEKLTDAILKGLPIEQGCHIAKLEPARDIDGRPILRLEVR